MPDTPKTPEPRNRSLPLHPFLVHFPVGLWLSAFVLDLVQVVRYTELLALASVTLLWLGVAFSIPSAWAGWRDSVRYTDRLTPEGRRILRGHQSLNLFLIGWYAVLASLRSFGAAGVASFSGFEFVLSLIGAVLLVRSARLGAALVFHHRVAVVPGDRPPEAERREVA